MTEEKIVNRIKKMLALASDSAATEGERDNALRMAYNLMAKYNIDQSRVEAAGQDPRVNYDFTGWSMVWAAHIHQAVGRLFFCRTIRGSKVNATKTIYHFVGKESNAVTASYLAAFVVTSILKEGRAQGWHNLSAPMRSFGTGVAHKLYERVAEMQKETEKEYDKQPGTALVLTSLYASEAEANEAFLNDSGMRLKASRASAKPVGDRDAYASGKVFGGSINLNPHVGGTSAKTLIG